MSVLNPAAPIPLRAQGHHATDDEVNGPSSHRWCAPYPPLADRPCCAGWPASLQTLWRACRAARDSLAALEAVAAQHPFDTELWRLVDAAHAAWLDVESYAEPLARASRSN